VAQWKHSVRGSEGRSKARSASVPLRRTKHLCQCVSGTPWETLASHGSCMAESGYPPEDSCTLTVSTPSLTAHLAARSTLPTAARSSSSSFRRLTAAADCVSVRDRPRPVVTGTEAGRDNATCLGGTNVRGGKVEEVVRASYSRRRREERVKTTWRSRRRGRKGMSRSRSRGRRRTPRRDGVIRRRSGPAGGEEYGQWAGLR
jgi:hypothetical protein